MSTYIEATGAGFAPQDQVELRWQFDEMRDGTLTLYAPTHNHGQGQETSFAQVVTRVLGVPLESVRLRTAGPEFYLTGNATGGSRSLLAVGSVLMLAAREMVKNGLAVAAEELEAAPGRHRVRRRELPHQGHRPRDFDPEPRAKARRRARHRLREQVRRHLSERLPHRRGGDRSRDRRGARSRPTSRATTPATSSTTRSSRGRCRAG